MEKYFTYPEKAPDLDIIHVDMDAFFAAVEQRDFPEYRGKPIVVGGSSHRGVVAAASYEARKYGIHSAMPSAKAAKLCPDLIFVRSRFGVYKSVSEDIMSVFNEYTDLVQPLSLDEAFLDVGYYLEAEGKSLDQTAEDIRKDIYEKTGLTCSAGASYNKFLAKVASDYNKPNGLYSIPKAVAWDFKMNLPIKKIPGIGKATRQKMNDMKIFKGKDIVDIGLDNLKKYFGKRGAFFYHILNDEYYNPVQTDRIRKSLGAERTFQNDITDPDIMEQILDAIAEKVSKGLKRHRLQGKSITVKIKSSDFNINTRSSTISTPTADSFKIAEVSKRLLRYPLVPPYPVRLLGISVSGLSSIVGGVGDQMMLEWRL
jgi:DNA polymerase-4